MTKDDLKKIARKYKVRKDDAICYLIVTEKNNYPNEPRYIKSIKIGFSSCGVKRLLAYDYRSKVIDIKVFPNGDDACFSEGLYVEALRKFGFKQITVEYFYYDEKINLFKNSFFEEVQNILKGGRNEAKKEI